jgi:hypothetical protein
MLEIAASASAQITEILGWTVAQVQRGSGTMLIMSADQCA